MTPAPGVAAILRAARAQGINPVPLIAIAHHESGLNPLAVGDQGTSFGLFQLHQGGALPAGTPRSTATNADWNASFAARAVKALGIQNLPVDQQVAQISRRFERPANPQGEIDDALSWLRKMMPGNAYLQAGTKPAPQTTRVAPTATLSPTAGLGAAQANLYQSILDSTQESQQRAQDALARISGTGGRLVAPALNVASIVAQAPAQAAQPQIAQKPHTTSVSANSSTAKIDPAVHSAVVAAQAYLGDPYHYGGASPETGFDCSGLIQWAYGKQGIKLPRTAAQQAAVGQTVPAGQLRYGDRLYFATEGGHGVTHAAIYLGNGKLLESPHTGDVIKVAPLAGYYANHLVVAKRGA